MKEILILFISLLSVPVSHAVVLDDCRYKSYQMAGPDNITVHKDGTLTVKTNADDDMRGRWGGQVRAEVNSGHIAHSGEIFEYRYTAVIDDTPMDWPVVIFQLKQSGHSPTVALEWKNNKVYIKHRYIKKGIEYGPTMASRTIIPGQPMKWKFNVKFSHGKDGFIEVYDGNDLTERYSGPTLFLDSDRIHLKYGIYSFRFVGGVTSRRIRILDCQAIKLE